MNTLFDKIWDAHVVQKVEEGPTQLYIDRLYCHESAGFRRYACSWFEMFPSGENLLYAGPQHSDSRSGQTD